MTLTLITAMAENRTIGKNGALPWHIKEDLMFFKQTTLNHPMIMGRKTRESFGENPLPNRPHLVVSRQNIVFKGSTVFDSLEKAIQKAQHSYPDQEIFIVGGAEIYAQAIDLVDKMIITHVMQTVIGDAFFPEFNPDDFIQTEIARHEQAIIPFYIKEYKRKNL